MKKDITLYCMSDNCKFKYDCKLNTFNHKVISVQGLYLNSWNGERDSCEMFEECDDCDGYIEEYFNYM